MKRIGMLLLLVALVAVVAGCGTVTSGATTTLSSTTTTSAPTTTEVPTTTTVLSKFFTKYSGTGSKILNLGESPDSTYFLVRLTTNAVAEVKEFDASGQQTYFVGNDFSLSSDVRSYDGRALARPEIVKLQINTKGAWTVEVQPLSEAVKLKAPGSVSGDSDDVVLLSGNPSSLNITGGSIGKSANFMVDYIQYGSTSVSNLVNELDAYDGVAVVAGDGCVTVQARVPWTITAQQ